MKHRSLENHYTKQVSYIAECTLCSYLADDPPPPINHRFMQDHYTDYISHIDICTDTSADRPHPLLQSIIDLQKTTTLQQFHGRLIPPPPPMTNRSMQDDCADYVLHIDVFTDTSVDRPHPLLQLTIALW